MKRPDEGAFGAAFLSSRVFRLCARLGGALALSALAACPSTPIYSEPEPVPIAAPERPAWLKEPLSWKKLEQIEQWIDHDSSRHSRELVAEAELQLNEGRMYFTRRDLDAGSVSRETLTVRVENAKAGFTKVLDNPAASSGQRVRAESGLRLCGVLMSTQKAQDVAIIKRAQWGARPARTGNMTPLKGGWSRITIHHSAETSSDPDGGSFEDSANTLRLIQKYHMDDPDHRWGDIGYHFAIDSGGRIFELRELQWQGAHAGGNNNQQNIGICMLGNLLKRSPTPAALKSLQLLLKDLRGKYRIPAERVAPHNEYGSTQCPGPSLTAWIKNYK
ncbi:MAG: N-acetylmuramoyl-L-alanine amidase [Planctomycetes bacterium]|nr:N-acetylmuramoyl-L-alanine amidase [Planctomycetota bacterium]